MSLPPAPSAPNSRPTSVVDRSWLPVVAKLEQLVNRVTTGGTGALSPDELLELGRLYRRAGALLERARTGGLAGSDVEGLNRLLLRAYPIVHAPAPRRRGPGFWHFLAVEFPCAFRREWVAMAASFGVFLLGGLVGWVVLQLRPDGADILFGPGWKESLEGVAQRHIGNQDWLPETIRPRASAAIMTNNIRVAFLTFASGVAACLGTFYLLGFNGLLLGAVTVVVHQHGVDLPFWAFVAPHGVIEIPAILIAGGVGLIIGYALVAPGRLYRGDALRLAARRAIPLVMGVVVMLVLAGLIEGFLSPRTDLAPEIKMAFATWALVCLAAWLGLAGRSAEKTPGAETTVP